MTKKTIISQISKQKYEPKSKKVWIVKLSSEFIGTIFLSWMIGLLGVSFGGIKFENLLTFGHKGTNFLVVGCWVWLDIFICIAIFSRWSCDLNPIISSYRILIKQNSIRYGLIKIFIQIFGGLVAGILIVATQQLVFNITEDYKDSLWSLESEWNWASFNINTPVSGAEYLSPTTRHLIAFFGEMLGVIILIWAVFNKSIKNKVAKDMIISFAIGIGVAALLPIGAVAWNPARLLATQYVFDIFKTGENIPSAMNMYVTYVAGELAGMFMFFWIVKFMEWKGILLWEKWMSFGVLNEN